jgi:aspartate aminotransferase-like enzyme
MRLSLFAKRPSNAVTAVALPPGVDGKPLVKFMQDRCHVTIAGGQGEMAGKVVRIAHMGAILPDDLLAGLVALEEALEALGYSVPPGAGVQAAQAILAQHTATPGLVQGMGQAATTPAR